MWRGGLPPLDCAAGPNQSPHSSQENTFCRFTTAAQSNGSVSASGLDFCHLIKILRPIRRTRHHHSGPRTRQCPLYTQINNQIFPTYPLPLREVLERAVLFEFLQAAA